jgi:(p)ppGpp synthase/HD superfamily hydrolase
MAVTEFTRQRWGHEDEELLCIAAGHDLLEDTAVTWQFLYDNFNVRVANGILKLSRFKGMEYGEYQLNVLNSVDAMKVKLCDLRHNMMESRVIMDANTKGRMLKYREFRDTIEEKLNELEVG